jgi:hypothetical protein
MDRKTIILIVIILLAIYFGYKMRTEYMTREEEQLTCKWIDTDGVVHNPTAKECYECYECINNNTGEVKIRIKGGCIAADTVDFEKEGAFNKYSNKQKCDLF